MNNNKGYPLKGLNNRDKVENEDNKKPLNDILSNRGKSSAQNACYSC